MREHHHGTFQNIAELTHIARPGIASQFRHGTVIHLRCRSLPRFGHLGHDCAGNEWDINLPFRKAWDLDRKDIDPIIEIGPEGPLVDAGLDVLMRGADKAEINLDLVIASDPLDGAVFKNAQQF